MPKKVSLQDIASRLDISKNAVSLALNGKPGVSDQTRSLVLQMAQRMNYGVPKPTSNKILVIIPEYIRYDSYFYNDIYWSIEAQAKYKGYTAILSCVTDEMQKNNQLPPIFNDIDVWGVITVGILSSSYMKHLLGLTHHIVSVDQCYYELDIDTVMTENLQGSYNITKHLIGVGHKDIGFVGSIGVTSSLYERWCGFQQAMFDAGLPVNQKHCVLSPSPLTSLLSEQKEIAARLQEMEDFPTAWVCGGDRIAIALIEAIRSFGYSVPKDISVVGFDNIDAAALVTPPLTTVDVNRKQLGSRAVDVLIQATKASDLKIKTSIFTSLVLRASVEMPPPQLLKPTHPEK